MPSKKRDAPEINASSMADIAFLLLVFFLVTTTIKKDTGLQVLLPPWSEDEPDPTKLKARNVFEVFVNADNQLLVRDEQLRASKLRERAKEFIFNPTGREDLSESPNKAIISLKNDRSTNYETYLTVYNELQAAYNELWDEQAQRDYKKPYAELNKAQQKDVRAKIPFVISEQEPDNVDG